MQPLGVLQGGRDDPAQLGVDLVTEQWGGVDDLLDVLLAGQSSPAPPQFGHVRSPLRRSLGSTSTTPDPPHVWHFGLGFGGRRGHGLTGAHLAHRHGLRHDEVVDRDPKDDADALGHLKRRLSLAQFDTRDQVLADRAPNLLGDLLGESPLRELCPLAKDRELAPPVEDVMSHAGDGTCRDRSRQELLCNDLSR